MKEAPGKCPICTQNLMITKLHCDHCNTTIEGSFSLCRFCRLTVEQKQFVETFIKCRGNIKEVEKDLGISYPTVRSRLDEVIFALGYAGKSYKDDARKKEILDRLGRDEINYHEALKLLEES